MASRDKADMNAFYQCIQYALEKLGKSKSGFERTVVSKFKSKDAWALGTSLLIIPELRVLVLTKRYVGSGNEIVHQTDSVATRACAVATKNKKDNIS